MINFDKAKSYAIQTYSVDFADESDLSDELFFCPECQEPILFEDWKQHDFLEGCPICGFDLMEEDDE